MSTITKWPVFQMWKGANTPSACLLAIVAATSMAFHTPSAQATIITHFFEGTDEGGTASAEVTFSDEVTNALLVTWDNTSPFALDDGTGDNHPVITAMGANLTPDLPSITGWTLFADTDTDSGSPIDIASFWDLKVDTTTGNVQLEFLAETDQGVKGGVYNDGANTGASSFPADVFPDLAELTLMFGSEYSLTRVDSSFLKMQSVGQGGEGSLRLFGSEDEGGGGFQQIPEPGMLSLLGIGLLGMGLARRRRI